MSADKDQSKPRACPVCGKPEVAEYRPFCSARCRAIDLNRWLGEVYRVPGSRSPGEGESDPAKNGED